MKFVKSHPIVGGLLLLMVVIVLCISQMVSKPVSEPTDLAANKKAAGQGNSTAQFNLGIAYGKGEGVPKDYQQAAEWYRKAAEQGHPSAQSNLAVLYYSGQGVPQNFTHAYAWFCLAASQGNIVAAKNRDLAAKELNPEQMSQAKQLSIEIHRKYGQNAQRAEP
jgi:uncharacterized protein